MTTEVLSSLRDESAFSTAFCIAFTEVVTVTVMTSLPTGSETVTVLSDGSGASSGSTTSWPVSVLVVDSLTTSPVSVFFISVWVYDGRSFSNTRSSGVSPGLSRSSSWFASPPPVVVCSITSASPSLGAKTTTEDDSSEPSASPSSAHARLGKPIVKRRVTINPRNTEIKPDLV